MDSVALRVLAITSCAAMLSAQQAAKPTGVTVSGHVYLQDTNGPARMATVMLQPIEAVDAIRSDKTLDKAVTTQSVQTVLDGSFTIPNVQPGAYYVVASSPGYVSPLYAVLTSSDSQRDSEARKAAATLAQRITVQANLPASVNVTLERGAAVSGTVLYDDGSPAAGLWVQLLVRKDGKWNPIPRIGSEASISSTATDDRGNFRIAGLPAQEYAVEVMLNLSKGTYVTDPHGNTSMSSTSEYSLTVYSGNHFRKKDAEGFAVSQGDEHGGEDIEIPVSRLHTLRGSVIAAHDGHPINGGRVALLYPDDKSEVNSTGVSSDAEFNFRFVPEGDYILRATGAADTEYTEKPNPYGNMPPTITESHVLRRYDQSEMPIHIGGDMTGVVIAVPDAQAQKTTASH